MDTEWCLAIEAWVMSLMTTKNSAGDNMQPCLTLLPTTKVAERVPLCSTRHLAPLYADLMTDTILCFFSVPSRGHLHPHCQRPFQCLQKSNANRNGIQHIARWLSAACQCGQRKNIQIWSLPVHDLWWNKEGLLSDAIWPWRWFWRRFWSTRHIFLANYRKSLDFPFFAIFTMIQMIHNGPFLGKRFAQPSFL